MFFTINNVLSKLFFKLMFKFFLKGEKYVIIVQKHEKIFNFL